MNNQTDDEIFNRIINELAILSVTDERLQHKQIVFFFTANNEFETLSISNGAEVMMGVDTIPSEAINKIKKYKEALNKGNNPQAYKIKQKKN
jgi:hypothetical protein